MCSIYGCDSISVDGTSCRLPSKSLPSKSTPPKKSKQIRAEPIRAGRKKNPFRFLDCLEIFRVAFRLDIQTLQIKSLHHFSNPYCPKPFVQLKTSHVKCIEFRNSTICSTHRVDNFLPYTADECTKKQGTQDTVLELALLLVNPNILQHHETRVCFSGNFMRTNPSLIHVVEQRV